MKYLDTLPIDQVLEKLGHFGRIFGAGEAAEVVEAKLVEAKKEQVTKDHIQREITAQDAAGHVIVVVFQEYPQGIFVAHASVQNLSGWMVNNGDHAHVFKETSSF